MTKQKGFILKCQNCGEIIKIEDKDFYTKQFDEEPKIQLNISWGYEYAEIECKCGNVIEF